VRVSNVVIDKTEATRRVTAYLERRDGRPNAFGKIAQGKTLKITGVTDTRYGWVFDTGPIEPPKSILDVLINGPGLIVVIRDTGAMHPLGSSLPDHLLLAAFEERLAANALGQDRS